MGLNRADDAAGDPGSGIPGGLGGKIVPPAVDDDRAADDLGDAEPVGEHGHERMAAAGKQGRQVARVKRVGQLPGLKCPLASAKLSPPHEFPSWMCRAKIPDAHGPVRQGRRQISATPSVSGPDG